MVLVPGRLPKTPLNRLEARILAAFVDFFPDGSYRPWILTRKRILERAGLSTKGGSANHALNGIPAGSSTGKPRPGLLAIEYVKMYVFDIEGIREVDYEITRAGKVALDAYLAANGPLPPVKNAAKNTNKRYLVS